MKVCSLFCGIGRNDLAFEQGGHEIVWANDSDKFACMTYRHNFSKVNLLKTIFVQWINRRFPIRYRRGGISVQTFLGLRKATRF